MSTRKRKQIKIEIYGKNRIVRNVVVDTENHLEGYYKNCWFKIEIETEFNYRGSMHYGPSRKTCYIWSTAPDGCYIYDGYGHHRGGINDGEPFTIDEALQDVLENILYEEKPNEK